MLLTPVSHVSRPGPVASPAAPRAAAVRPSAPADVPTGTSLVGGSGGHAVWHGEQQLHVFRLPARVNGQVAAPLELGATDERVVRFLEEYRDSAFCADWRGHTRELRGAQELNAAIYQVSAPASATPCTRCQGECGTFVTCTYGPGVCGSCRFQHNGATCVLPTVEEDAREYLARENQIYLPPTNSNGSRIGHAQNHPRPISNSIQVQVAENPQTTYQADTEGDPSDQSQDSHQADNRSQSGRAAVPELKGITDTSSASESATEAHARPVVTNQQLMDSLMLRTNELRATHSETSRQGVALAQLQEQQERQQAESVTRNMEQLDLNQPATEDGNSAEPGNDEDNSGDNDDDDTDNHDQSDEDQGEDKSVAGKEPENTGKVMCAISELAKQKLGVSLDFSSCNTLYK
ncbi:hypothetical protein KEM55_007124 [Ascosphaera atra]|nr:hypothetical protein KEM55_007124 [Ascosphaera atra]